MKRILVLGSHGRLGAALPRQWGKRFDVVGLSRQDLDVSDFGKLEAELAARDFEVVVNCTGATSLEKCEDHPDLARVLNQEAPGIMAEAAASKGAMMIHFSTDYVFDGKTRTLLTEDDPAAPLNMYGRSKLAGEEAVLAASERHAVFRVSWVFGPDKPSFVDMILNRALTHDRVEAVADKFSSPTYTHDVAEWLIPFLGGEAPGGLYHACNHGSCSWRQFAEAGLTLAAQCGWPLKTRTVEPLPMAEMTTFRVARPVHTSMDCRKLGALVPIRPWQEALEEYIRLQTPGHPG